MFLAPGELTRDLEEAGFGEAQENYRQYTWKFPDRAFMAQFCSDLFRLSSATQAEVLSALETTLEITEELGKINMGWSLIYARAGKPVN